jgi:hypothetical protein
MRFEDFLFFCKLAHFVDFFGTHTHTEVYLLYWYKSTNTDANAPAMCKALKTKRSMRLHNAM